MMWLHVFVIRKTSEVIVENIKVQNSVCHMLLFARLQPKQNIKQGYVSILHTKQQGINYFKKILWLETSL